MLTELEKLLYNNISTVIKAFKYEILHNFPALPISTFFLATLIAEALLS